MAYRFLHSHLSTFTAALEDEIACSRLLGGTRHPLVDGRETGRSLNGWLYEFRLENEARIPDDTKVEVVTHGKERILGTVVVTEDFNVTLDLEQPIRSRLDSAMLVVQLWYILEALRDRLRGLCDVPLVGSDLFRQMCIPGGTSGSGQPFADSNLNPSQLDAANLALKERCTFVWGPPGTGKTYTVARLASEAEHRQKTVLVTAYSNAALDVAMSAIAAQFEAQPAIQCAGAVLRIGTPALREVSDHSWLGTKAALRLKQPKLIDEYDSLRARLAKWTNATRSGEVDQLRARLRELRETIRIAEEQMAMSARILGCTLAKLAIWEPFLKYSANMVILDEASMASAPFAALAASSGREQFVVAGDFRQLPPIVLSRTPSTKRCLESTAFELGGAVRSVDHGGGDHRLVMLNVQYRMHPSISRLISDVFYRGKLSDAVGMEDKRAVIAEAPPLKGSSLILLDTSESGAEAMNEPPTMGFSKYNVMHAMALIGLLANSLRYHHDIAVITPFRAQAKLVKRFVDSFGWGSVVKVSTVHRFQGGEADLVIVDLVLAAKGRGLTQLLEGPMGSSAARLLNVALSRARGKLIVLADSRFIREKSGPRQALGVVLRELEDRARVEQLDQSRIARLIRNNTKGNHFFSQCDSRDIPVWAAIGRGLYVLPPDQIAVDAQDGSAILVHSRSAVAYLQQLLGESLGPK